MNVNRAVVMILLMGGWMLPVWAGTPPGILHQKAPLWNVDQWLNLPEDRRTLDRADVDGRVIYLYFFQAWCPGCHASGFPTLQRVQEEFLDQEDVALVAIQTVFEGAAHNTFEHAEAIIEKYALTHPVGHVGSGKNAPAIMTRYRSGGTPWTVIIDKQGVVQFNGFHIQPDDAISLIQTLR